MHSALIEGLASQRAEELRAAAATRQRATAAVTRRAEPPLSITPLFTPPSITPPSITQRAGWALIQAGLRLAVRPAGDR